MGFFEYAWEISPQKDNLLTKIHVDANLRLPSIMSDKAGFTVKVPEPLVSSEGRISFLGFNFPADASGKVMAGRLFRASIVHLTTHTLMPGYRERIMRTKKRSIHEIFAQSIVDDVYVNAYVLSKAQDKLPDLAFANSLVFSRAKPVTRVLNQSTRLMIALLSRLNIGSVKGRLTSDETEIVNQLFRTLIESRGSISRSFVDDKIRLAEIIDIATNCVISALDEYGPFVEVPAMPYAEQEGFCSTFPIGSIPQEEELVNGFRNSLRALGGAEGLESSMDSCWAKETDLETLQAFDSGFYLRVKEKKVLARVSQYVEGTGLRAVFFPETDYTQYLRARILLSGGTRRLLDSLRIAQDALDEDPGKEMGQLDLTAVIQVLASRKPATDVFMKDEYLSKSFSWGVLLDSSASMRVKGEFARALVICIAEATKELLSDPSSWGLFAFNDSFYILKDLSETYSSRVRARIGGLKFDGLSYLPDAVRVAGSILGRRYDEQRFLIVISDGWPYGYVDIEDALKESIEEMEKRGVIVIGVGIETERMKRFFKLNSPIYDEKDLVRKFAKIYVDASANALET